jgi:hypothetical protein
MKNLKELIKTLCPNGCDHHRLKDVILKDQFKQISASKLNALKSITANEIKLLPSSQNFD